MQNLRYSSGRRRLCLLPALLASTSGTRGGRELAVSRRGSLGFVRVGEQAGRFGRHTVRTEGWETVRHGDVFMCRCL